MKITKEIVLEAKRIAQDDYIQECVKNKTHNPKYERTWRKVPTKIKEDFWISSVKRFGGITLVQERFDTRIKVGGKFIIMSLPNYLDIFFIQGNSFPKSITNYQKNFVLRKNFSWILMPCRKKYLNPRSRFHFLLRNLQWESFYSRMFIFKYHSNWSC